MTTNWISVHEKLPTKGEKCWYYFDMVGQHRGFYDGYYIDEDGKEYLDMHVFFCEYGFLTGDVTHWHQDQEEMPNAPVIN